MVWLDEMAVTVTQAKARMPPAMFLRVLRAANMTMQDAKNYMTLSQDLAQAREESLAAASAAMRASVKSCVRFSA
jgi:hypothetical protein